MVGVSVGVTQSHADTAVTQQPETFKTLYNTHGQMLRVQTIAADASKVSLELGAFPNGLYWIVLFNEAGEMLGTTKVSIAH